MTRRYDASAIEPAWVARWDDERLYEAVDDPADTRPRFFALDMFRTPARPPWGTEAFSAGDAVTRYRRCAATTCRTRSGGTRSGSLPRTPRSSAASRPALDRRQHRAQAVVQADGHVVRLVAPAAHLRSRYSRGPNSCSSPLREGPCLSEGVAGQLVPEGRHRARERAGDPSACERWHAGGASQPDAVVLPDHGLRAATARRREELIDWPERV